MDSAVVADSDVVESPDEVRGVAREAPGAELVAVLLAQYAAPALLPVWIAVVALREKLPALHLRATHLELILPADP